MTSILNLTETETFHEKKKRASARDRTLPLRKICRKHPICLAPNKNVELWKAAHELKLVAAFAVVLDNCVQVRHNLFSASVVSPYCGDVLQNLHFFQRSRSFSLPGSLFVAFVQRFGPHGQNTNDRDLESGFGWNEMI